jgi:hypothetical protein
MPCAPWLTAVQLTSTRDASTYRSYRSRSSPTPPLRAPPNSAACSRSGLVLCLLAVPLHHRLERLDVLVGVPG